MKIWIISDTHFGKKNGNIEKWLKIMRDYFFEFFIPILEENVKNGDILVIAGDVFDNREAIDMRATTLAVDVFEKLASILPVHTLVGNHDCFHQSVSHINAIASIRNIKNVTYYDTPTKIEYNNKSILFMPYQNDTLAEKEILIKNKADILFCHSDLNGCKTQLNPYRPLNKSLLEIEDFESFKYVYSGHIHIRQENKNHTFVGSPYHLDRNDIGNTKGIYIHNTKNDKVTFIENDYSPEFKKLEIVQEEDLKIIKKLKSQDIVDVSISNTLLVNNSKVRATIDNTLNKLSIDRITYVNDLVVEEKVEDKEVKEYKDKTIKEFAFDWIDELPISENVEFFNIIDLKEDMNNILSEVFKIQETK